MAKPVSTREAEVIQLHAKFLQQDDFNTPLKSLLEAGIRRFETLKFPAKKHEMYSFVNTHELATTAFTQATGGPVDADWVQNQIYPSCKQSVIVFVDGRYHEGLSDISALGDSLKLVPLEKAVEDEAIFSYLKQSLEEENDVFAALNGAFAGQGLLVDVPEKTQLETPLQVVYVSTAGSANPVASFPRLLVRLGVLAEMKLVVKFVGQGENYFLNAVQDFMIGPDAGLTCAQVQFDGPKTWHCSKTRVQVARNGRFVTTNASSGSRMTRHHYQVHLKEEGADAQLNGASVLINEEQVHNFVRVHHESPHCTSNQLFKNVVNHRGRSSFDGTVIVNQDAQQTYSDQLINNLMLSDEAQADNKPNLMIFADDVKCTHGATVGQIDEDQLFYLKTRGLSQEVAQTLLTTSFVETVIQTVPFPEVVEELDRILLKKLEANHG